MATYLLVHGAWGSGWGYRQVAANLRAAGHDVFAPTLTGLGERAHLASPATNLSMHIADVTTLIDYEGLSDIILAGHSYGGMVITGAASQRPAAIRSLIYIDAFVPEDRQALWDLISEDVRRTTFDRQRCTPGFVAPPPGLAPRVDHPHSNHPLLCFMEPIAVTEAVKEIPNRTYVYATLNAPTSFTQFRGRYGDDPAWRMHEMATGHFVMDDDPDGLTALLLEEAAR
jgi:pimeloyl-ACP methyl ester carboxylesterase